jgi:uncharacterized protein YkwD
MIRLEKLESRLLLSAVDPSGDEQQALELINRMRQNPAAELPLLENSTDSGVQSALSFFNVNLTTLAQQWATLTPAPPLDWNDDLATAAVTHDRLMEMDNMQSHQLPGEADLPTRVTAAGYSNYSDLEESVFAYATSVFDAHASFAIDWGDNPPSGIQNPPGHRENLMSTGVTDIGIAVISGPGDGDGTTTGPLLFTEDFGAQFNAGNPFILGSVFNDTNGDGYYTSGEGVASVNVTADGAGGSFTTTTLSAGGYQVQVPAGTYTLTFSGGSLSQSYTISNVIVGASNVERDLNLSVTGTAASLAFTQQPTSITAGTAFPPSVSVDVLDQYGDPATGFSGSVTLALKTAPAGASFTPITVTAQNGVATFSNIPALDIAGGYKFKATASGLSPAKSAKFTVSPAAAAQLAFVQEPANIAVGTTFSQPITVDVEDQFGNVLTGDDATTVTLGSKVVPVGVSFTPIPMTDDDGVAMFTVIPDFTIAGGYKLKATSPGLTPAKSIKFFVSAAV